MISSETPSLYVLFHVLYLQYLINLGDIRHMAVVGYARVSSVGQSLEVQQEKLVSYGVDKLFAEKLLGTTAAFFTLHWIIRTIRSEFAFKSVIFFPQKLQIERLHLN